MINSKNWINRVCNFIIANPKKCILSSILLTLLLMISLPKLQSDYSVKIWFRTDDPVLTQLDEFERKFGNDQVVIIGIRPTDGVFTAQNLKKLYEITENTWLMPEVMRVESLTNFHHSYAEGDDIIIEPFYDPDHNYTDEELKTLQMRANNNPMAKNRYIDQHGEVTVITAYMKPVFDEQEADYEYVTDKFREMLKAYQGSDTKIYLSGSAPVNDAFKEVANHDLMTMIPISFTIMLIFLFFVFRRFWDVVTPLFAILLLVSATFGLAPLLGIKFNNVTSAIPGILIAICIADVIHILETFQYKLSTGSDTRDSLLYSLKKNFIPTALTSFTTAIGFIGLTTTDLMPVRDLGILAAFGSISAWFVSYFLISPILLFIPHKLTKSTTKRHKYSSLVADALPDFIIKYRYLLVFFFLGLSAFSIYLGTLNEVNADPFSYLRETVQVRRDNDFFRNHFGGLAGPQIVIRSDGVDGIKNPEFLQKVDQFEKWIEAKPYVNQLISILDIIKDLNMNLNNGKTNEYKIPDSQNTIAEELFLYSLSLPQGLSLNNLVTLDYSEIRLSIMWSLSDSKTTLSEVEKIEKKAKELGLNIYVTGKMFLYHRMNDYIVKTFFTSIAVAVGTIALLMILIFGSIKLGILSLFPNLIPLTYGIGVLTLSGNSIDIGSSLVTSVCLGIAIDDTIHFLTHYSMEKKNGLSPIEALREIFLNTAPALCFTTITLIFGFGVFAFSEFTPNITFGVLSAIILAMALAVDLLFLPAMLMIIDRK